MNIELVLAAKNTIGESPTWVASENALYWIDVKQPALFKFAVKTGTQRTWGLPSDIGAFALALDHPKGPSAVVALRHGIHRLDLKSSLLERLAPPPFDPERFRFNEGACDSMGRFWVGAMYDPLKPETKGTAPETAPLHSFTLNQGLRAEPDATDLHNGMAWSPDETAFYLSYTSKGEIYRYRYDAHTGQISDKQRFAHVAKEEGAPDGAAIDAKGGYWCALHGGNRIRRFFPDGTHDIDIPLPVSQPTMCAFAGDTLEYLYITSATDGLSAAQLAEQPLAGALFRVRVPVQGQPRFYAVR